MNLRRVVPVEVRKVYLDNLAEWIEVPVFDQEEVIRLVNDIDWEGLDMRAYKKTLIEHWPGLSATIKAKLKNPAVRDELYEALLHENWGLSPKSALLDSDNEDVRAWFATNKARGRKPDVIR